jgi:hypothetical protein
VTEEIYNNNNKFKRPATRRIFYRGLFSEMKRNRTFVCISGSSSLTCVLSYDFTLHHHLWAHCIMTGNAKSLHI